MRISTTTSAATLHVTLSAFASAYKGGVQRKMMAPPQMIATMDTRSPLALTPEVEEFRRQFEQLAIDADALVAPLSDAEFSWQPGPERWSVAQCIDHLNATARVYLPVLDEGIADAIRRGLYGPGPYAYNWVGRVHVLVAQPNSWIRARTTRPFYPAPSRPRHEIMAAFRAYQVQYIDRLRQANGVDLARARVRVPANGWLRIPLGSGFQLMVAHSRRHLAQAKRVMDAENFPG
jgi:DinB family protein